MELNKNVLKESDLNKCEALNIDLTDAKEFTSESLKLVDLVEP